MTPAPEPAATRPPAIEVHVHGSCGLTQDEVIAAYLRRRPPASAIAMDIWNGDHEVLI